MPFPAVISLIVMHGSTFKLLDVLHEHFALLVCLFCIANFLAIVLAQVLSDFCDDFMYVQCDFFQPDKNISNYFVALRCLSDRMFPDQRFN